jgi:hypothetical protein
MEEMEKLAREIYEGIRKLEKGSGVPAREGLEIPDSM